MRFEERSTKAVLADYEFLANRNWKQQQLGAWPESSDEEHLAELKSAPASLYPSDVPLECTEMASDALLGHTLSETEHTALCLRGVNRRVRKALGSGVLGFPSPLRHAVLPHGPVLLGKAGPLRFVKDARQLIGQREPRSPAVRGLAQQAQVLGP
jgi:hypothetical protein